MKPASVTTKKIARQLMHRSRAVARGVAISVPTFDALVFNAIMAPRLFGK
jgi:Flp pilus assembly protein protease CpaA